ncbi:SixA phosphatase family protein [Microbulbifer yueqingensis]|uniref:Phosphohistidine phosphatase n=1 Tax=Microbulbifer yueqingensis TaxID=658219 RepID=A0A1G9BEQ3_9GAMM|nr:histidine phosphatase family protein [Microbulbifer yueqingensis]SDK38028.1 phosphohistidine phosphatase [Microbulbifer yueqingensis]
MKKLTLIRHAKSSWADPTLDDFDRPLNKRGERDLPAMAQRVRELGLVPDRLLTSGAVRALTTARAVAAALELDPDQVVVQPGLYACSYQAMLQHLQQQDDRWHHLMVVGHNPGLENLGCYLTGDRLARFPTAAVLHMQLGITRWCELAESCGSVELFDYPKLHKQD